MSELKPTGGESVQRPLFAMPVQRLSDPYGLVHYPLPSDYYPVGHPCYPKPAHTHDTAAATGRCERLRRLMMA